MDQIPSIATENINEKIVEWPLPGGFFQILKEKTPHFKASQNGTN
jgi:hypothetical protein